MSKLLSHYRRRLAEKGVREIIASRYRWYKVRFIGRVVELFGNRIRIDGMTFSVDSPQLSTGDKGVLTFGLHEMEERALLKRWMPSDLPVLEFGGGMGVVSCLLNRKLENPSRHVVVEANPEMIPLLEHNREINGLNFTVINKAIAYDADYIDLSIRDFVGSSIIGASVGNTVKVSTTSISSLMSEMNFGKAGIVCDIEGGEADIINREMPVLGDRIQFFMAEMHPKILGDDVVKKLLIVLIALGFTLKEKIGDCVFFARN
jgi:FkbM family methyltransferase